MKERKFSFSLIALILGGACLVFGLIGLLLGNDPQVTPLVLIAGVICLIYAFTHRMPLGRIVAGIGVVGCVVAVVFDLAVWGRNLHTWTFLALCVSMAVYLLFEIFLRDRLAKQPVPEAKPAPAKPEPPTGYYVIRKTSDGAYIFNLHAANHEEICVSRRYPTPEECRSAIDVFRRTSDGAPLDDATRLDTDRLTGKRYEMYRGEGQEFIFRLKDEDGNILIGSQGYKTKDSCRRGSQSVQKNATTRKVVEQLGDEDVFTPDDFYEKLFIDNARETLEKEIAVVREEAERKMAEIATHPTETFEDVAGGVEAVGIVFPERDRVYFYGPAGHQFRVGDIVLVPTQTNDRMVAVTVPNVHLPEERIVRPFKNIIEVVTQSGSRND